jgi:uronate dehydrogenase
LRVTDVRDLGRACNGEEIAIGDLLNPPFVASVMRDGDAVLHFAGMPGLHPFESLLPANILAIDRVYEQAQRRMSHVASTGPAQPRSISRARAAYDARA